MFGTRLCILKKGLQEKFLEELKNVFESYYPIENQSDYTSMVNAHHYERMKQYINDAISKGAVVVPLGHPARKPTYNSNNSYP